MNKIKNGLLWRISWSGFSIILAVLSLAEFINNKNYIHLMFSLAWSLLAISYFLNPIVLNWNTKLSEVKYASAGYAIGPLIIVGPCFLVAGVLMLVAGCLNVSNMLGLNL